MPSWVWFVLGVVTGGIALVIGGFIWVAKAFEKGPF